jgi:hypothetical protein
LSHFFPPILGGRRMVMSLMWHPLLEWRRAHSRRMENLSSSPFSSSAVKNGEFSEKVSPQASCISHTRGRGTLLEFSLHPFLTRGEELCLILPFLTRGKELCLILREGHKGVSHLSLWRSYDPIGSSFSSLSILREPILRPPRRCDNP